MKVSVISSRFLKISVAFYNFLKTRWSSVISQDLAGGNAGYSSLVRDSAISLGPAGDSAGYLDTLKTSADRLVGTLKASAAYLGPAGGVAGFQGLAEAALIIEVPPEAARAIQTPSDVVSGT